MKISYSENCSETISLAASELSAYLIRMRPKLQEEDWKFTLSTDGSLFPDSRNDGYYVKVSQEGGSIVGKNDRSVLLGVYDYLHYLGCRFLMPGKQYERIPSVRKEQLWADYKKQAEFYHRGVCIEGADSFENIMDFVEWLPKLGYNSFFLQFKTPYAFLSRWYGHMENPYTDAEKYTPEDAKEAKNKLEKAIKARGLLLHEAGHGWTGELLGFQTVSWEQGNMPEDGKYTYRMAELHGKRALFKGIPADTNLCYHSNDTIEDFAGLVTEYAKENPCADYLHVWLADEYNNVCECPACRKTTLSDQYVKLLNKIDEKLTEAGLDTHIVFLLYQELLWPPIEKRIRNQDRFVLMFAPISRTFEKSYEVTDTDAEIPVFVRNHIVLPESPRENMAFLRKWQGLFQGDSFLYDYPLGRAHYGDFGYVHMAEIIYSDIHKLRQMGLNGYISCQELRAAFPNAFPNYVMGYALCNKEVSLEELTEEYFSACYGEAWRKVLKYLTRLSDLNCCDYINGKGERISLEIVKRMGQIKECCRIFEKETQCHQEEGGRWENIYWEVLEYHRKYMLLLADGVELLASGNEAAAFKRWEEFREFICKNEKEYQPFLDVYRVLEVTQKYTGFAESGKERLK